MIIGYFIGSQRQKNSFINTKTANQLFDEYLTNKLTSQVSTPTIPFSLSQQCSNDANALVNKMQQIEDKRMQEALQYHKGYVTMELNGSAFSSELNSCVAEIDKTILQDSVLLRIDYIYDTANDKILAQCMISNDGSCGSSSFIITYPHGLNQKPTWTDWANYRGSIGL